MKCDMIFLNILKKREIFWNNVSCGFSYIQKPCSTAHNDIHFKSLYNNNLS